MNIKPTMAALGVALLGVSGAAWGVDVEHGSSSAGREPATAEPGRLYQVDQQITRQVANGCRYDATVRGTVREINLEGRATAEARYVPRLAVSAQLKCGEGIGSHRSREVTPMPDFSRAQLESDLSLRGRVFSSRDGAICSYRPDVGFEGGRLVVRGVDGSCAAQPPRGGGPTAPGTRPRGEATSGSSFRMVSRDGRDVIEYVDFAGHR